MENSNLIPITPSQYQEYLQLKLRARDEDLSLQALGVALLSYLRRTAVLQLACFLALLTVALGVRLVLTRISSGSPLHERLTLAQTMLPAAQELRQGAAVYNLDHAPHFDEVSALFKDSGFCSASCGLAPGQAEFRTYEGTRFVVRSSVKPELTIDVTQQARGTQAYILFDITGSAPSQLKEIQDTVQARIDSLWNERLSVLRRQEEVATAAHQTQEALYFSQFAKVKLAPLFHESVREREAPPLKVFLACACLAWLLLSALAFNSRMDYARPEAGKAL